MSAQQDAKNKTQKPQDTSGKNTSWLSRHVDAVCVLVILAFSTMFFVNLGSGHLVAADEQTYSQWTFHMIKTGDYFTPWAYGSLFWLGKPPLTMWLMSLSYQIFGVTNFAARIWSAIFGALSLGSHLLFGKETLQPLRRLALSSHLRLIRNLLRLCAARHDGCPAGLLHLGQHLLLCLKRKNRKPRIRYAALSGLFFGLALMTKQIEALLVLIIMFLYLVGDKEKPPVSGHKKLHPFLGSWASDFFSVAHLHGCPFRVAVLAVVLRLRHRFAFCRRRLRITLEATSTTSTTSPTTKTILPDSCCLSRLPCAFSTRFETRQRRTR